MATQTGPQPLGDADDALRTLTEEAVGHLASFEKPSASEGERRAATWIAERLRAEGARDVRVEEERAHGTYWWPLGLLALAGGLASLSRRRWVRLLGGAVAAAGIADDISGGRLWFRRAALPSKPTWNVVAEAGDAQAERTVVVVAHHDAAHWSLLFAPQLPAVLRQALPGPARALRHDAPGDVPRVRRAAARGAQRAARLARAAAPGRRSSPSGRPRRWPRSARARPSRGRTTTSAASRRCSGSPARCARVRSRASASLLVSTGSEESFMEGMQAFARRHFAALPVDRTHVICVDTVGSPTLMQLEAEGMLRMREYPADFKDLVSDVAADRPGSSSCAGCASATPRTG